MSDGNNYTTWELPSPLGGIILHKHYNRDYEMYVICGQRGSLIDEIEENLRGFIN